MGESSGPESDRIRQLEERMARIQAEIADLRASRTVQRRQASGTQRTKRGASRRAVLKWGGAAAAAAAVSMVTSEQPAHAADGDVIHAGQTTTSSSPTVLNPVSGASPNPLLMVDNSSVTGNVSTVVAGIVAAGPATNGVGIIGEVGTTFNFSSSTGVGVFGGTSTFGGTGVNGYASTGTAAVGVYGTTLGGYGVVGASEFGIDIGTFGTGRIYQHLQGTAGAPTYDAFAGESIRDGLGDLYLCVASGPPSIWVRALYVLPGYTGGATVYLSKPIRLLDTRDNDDTDAQYNNTGPIFTGTPYTLQIAGDSWQSVQVPSSAVGAIGKVTVISGDGGTGFVAIVPHGVTPTTGTLPYGADQTIASAFNVGLGGSPGSIDIVVTGTAVDVVIDLFGVTA